MKRTRSVFPVLVNIVKGTKVQLNKEWARAANGGVAPKTYPVGRKGTVTGFSLAPGCVRLQFDGSKSSQTFHITFLDVLKS